AIKSGQAAALRNDVSILCTGTWATSALRWIEQVRDGNQPILLTGEAGCGKSLLAQLIHFSSRRAGSPLMTLRCPERDAKDLEFELLGEIPPRNRTSASPKRSIFSLAANGTVLIDRADRLMRIVQHRLARAIASRRYSPVGGGDHLPLESRLIFTV